MNLGLVLMECEDWQKHDSLSEVSQQLQHVVVGQFVAVLSVES